MINRRTLVQSLLAAALSGCRVLSERSRDSSGSISGLRVVVVGAGIVGASIAYHLARAGAKVTVIDKQGPATHASRGTFAWINATWAKQPRSYHKLNQDSVSNWQTLTEELRIPVRWGGSLEWFDSPQRQSALAAQISEQARWGEAAQMIGPETCWQLEPEVNFGGAQQVAYSGNDGALDPVAATVLLLAAAQEFGATISYPNELTEVSSVRGRVTAAQTTKGPIETDRIVLATGAAPDASQRFAGIDIPQRSTPGVIAITAPMDRILNRILVAPGIHIHQRGDGRVVLGEQGGAPDNAAHAARLAGRPNEFPSEVFAQQHADRMLEVARDFLPSIASAQVEQIYIGWRPLPIDGHPVLGESPNQRDVFLALMHSGVTLAPLVGQLVAQEISGAISLDRLAPFRPARQFEVISRY